MDAFEKNQDNYEKLFLFEFLVDNVSVYNSRLKLDKKTVSLLGPLAVRFQFLNYPPIEVNEDSFTPGTKPLLEDTKVCLKSGKSCMFSLSSLKSQKVLNQSTFDVFLTVYKYKLQRYTPGKEVEKPEEVFIGRTKINLGSVFKDLFHASKETSKRLSHTKTACSKLIDDNGEDVGKITFLVRVSCFGFMVMTGFQLPVEEQKDFKFKNIEYDRVEDKVVAEQPKEDSCRACNAPQKEDEKAKGDAKKKHREKRRSHKKEKEISNAPAQAPPPGCPFGFPPCPCVCRMNQPSGRAGEQSSFAGQSGPSLSNNESTNPNRARDMDIDPGSVGIRGNQLVMKMPDKDAVPLVPVEGKFASAVYYKMEDEKQNGARNIVQILPKNPQETDASKTDEKQDVLLLKLGKKRMEAGRKPKLEVELRTPKKKEEKPQMETKDTQYLESDIPKPPKSAGSKKGGKGGKGGKGKKK